MAEEATSTAAAEETGTTFVQPEETVSEPTSGSGDDREGLVSFEDEAVTEEMLLGEDLGDEGEAKEETADAKEEDKESGEEKEEAKEEAKTEGEDKQEKEEKPTIPPGYVPVSEVQTERAKRQEAQSTIADLQQQLEAALKRTPSDSSGDDPFNAPELPKYLEDFKVLSDDEEQDLIDDDPAEAVRYQARLRKFTEHQQAVKDVEQRKADHERTASQAKQFEKDQVELANKKLTDAIPGFFDEDNQDRKDLTAFAKEVGFQAFALTDPRTKFIMPDGRQGIMGEAATDIILMLKNVRDRIASSAATIREEIIKEVTAKIKAGEDLSAPSIGEVPRSGNDGPKKVTIKSEDDLAKLSPKEQKMYLSGDL